MAILDAQSQGLTTVEVETAGLNYYDQHCSTTSIWNGVNISGEIQWPAGAVRSIFQLTYPQKWTTVGSGELSGLDDNSLWRADPKFIAQQVPTAIKVSNGVATVTVPSTRSMRPGTVLIMEGTASDDLNLPIKVSTVPSRTTFTFPYSGTGTISGPRTVALTRVQGLCGNWYAPGNVTDPPYNPWKAAQNYASGSIIVPAEAGNAAGYIWQTSGGTAGATEPTWTQQVGATVTDNGQTWTNLGQFCMATLTLPTTHGFLTGGLPVTIADTTTILDGDRYAFTTSNPASGAYFFTIAYFGAPFNVSSKGSAIITPRLSEPLVDLGESIGPHGVDMGCAAHRMAFDAGGLPGSITVFSGTANENCGMEKVMLKNSCRRGYWVMKTANGVPANWSDRELQIYGCEADTPSAAGTPFNSIPWTGVDFYAGANAVQGFQNATIRPSGEHANILAVGMQLGAMQGSKFSDLHFEHELYGIQLVKRGTSSQTSSGLVFLGISGGTGRFVDGAGLFGAMFENDAQGGTFWSVQGINKGGSTYIVDDAQGGNSFTNGKALPDSFCESYKLNLTTAKPECEIHNTQP